MRSFLFVTMAIAMVSVAGCSCANETTGDPDVGARDAGRDGAPTDTRPIEEDPVAHDTGPDVGPIDDVGIDAPMAIDDTGVDAPVAIDMGTDAPATSADTGTDAPITLVDAGGCISGSDCLGSEYCDYPTGACSGVGTCTSRGIGRFCTALCAPQCGCDGTTYQNECHRHQAGTSLASDGPCPGDPAPCGVTCGCASDGDCPGRNKECVQTPTGGVCEDIVARPMCWRDSDCAGGQTCNNANVCGCGMLCIIADRPGTCG